MKINARTFFWLLAFVAIVVLLRLFVFEIRTVENNEMAPTLLHGDRVLVYTRATVRRGDVVECQHPRVPGRRVFGRVMAMSGDRIAIERGVPKINGVAVGVSLPTPGRYVLADALTGRTNTLDIHQEEFEGGSEAMYLVSAHSANARLEMREKRVPRGWFLLADNRRAIGLDSRAFGVVDPALCSGVPILVAWPGPATGVMAPSERRFDVIR